MPDEILTFDYEQFITLFPQFSNSVVYPESTLQLNWTQATNYISNVVNCSNLNSDERDYALNLLTAHITYINTQIQSGQNPSIMQNATIDKVTVGVVPPPIRNGWRYWLNTSPYGQQLLALLEVHIVGGTYVPACNIYGFGAWF